MKNIIKLISIFLLGLLFGVGGSLCLFIPNSQYYQLDRTVSSIENLKKVGVDGELKGLYNRIEIEVCTAVHTYNSVWALSSFMDLRIIKRAFKLLDVSEQNEKEFCEQINDRVKELTKSHNS